MLETPLEDHMEQVMQSKVLDLKDAMNYIADRMQYITYDDDGKFNNCSVFIQDPFYQPKQSLYHLTCLDRNRADMKASRFCQCLWAYQAIYEQEVCGLTYLVLFVELK